MSGLEREIDRLRQVIRDAPCPWTTCCRHHQVPNRDDEMEWRPCWKARGLRDYVVPDDAQGELLEVAS